MILFYFISFHFISFHFISFHFISFHSPPPIPLFNNPPPPPPPHTQKKKQTPYEGAVFLFDLSLSSDYPSSPPLVYYHSCGPRLHPNLYENGRVCLSLLGTWSGKGVEVWSSQSNMLQVVLSVQGLILGLLLFFFFFFFFFLIYFYFLVLFFFYFLVLLIFFIPNSSLFPLPHHHHHHHHHHQEPLNPII